VLGLEDLPLVHYSRDEDEVLLRRFLESGRYHAVVANPPYIVPKDKAANEAYRKRYRKVCYKQYSLAVPFLERIFELAVKDGFTGQITANSFMKREFGKKLIENFFPTVDLTHVIDTSGAYIPGHGTPTVILFGQRRQPMENTIRTVMGIKGEPSTPENPAEGLVWSAICDQVDVCGSQSDFVSVADSDRAAFHKHPWSIGGGGAKELYSLLNSVKSKDLAELTIAIGRVAHTGNDDAYVADKSALMRQGIPISQLCYFVEGEVLRDWQLVATATTCVFPYDNNLQPFFDSATSPTFRWLWQFRDQLWGRREPNGTHREIGKTWYELSRFHPERFRGPLIAFAFVATHNHFVFDRGGKVFKQSAPVIKLPADATDDDHLALLGLLNSSIACFWLKQVSNGKHKGADPAYQRFEFDGTKLQVFPVPSNRPLRIAKLIDMCALKIQENTAVSALSRINVNFADDLIKVESTRIDVQQQIFALQEELDWQCYQLYDLVSQDITFKNELPSLQLGQRAFEIVMARKIAIGDLETTWFERHNSVPITELPTDWPDDYKKLVQRRIEIIESNPNIDLIEQPEYKRRWNTEPWDSQLERALKTWLGSKPTSTSTDA